MAALGAPTDAECGLVVDVDVAAEQLKQRQACVAHLREQGVHASLLPAEAAALPLSPEGEGEEQAREGSGGKDRAAGGGGGAELAAAAGGQLDGQPYSVQMWGLRKVYQVRRKKCTCICKCWLRVACWFVVRLVCLRPCLPACLPLCSATGAGLERGMR